MRRTLPTLLLLLTSALAARAADSQVKITGPSQTTSSYRLNLDGFARQEWTNNQYFPLGNDKRWQVRLMPSAEIGRTWFIAGAGGDFSYGEKDNFKDVPATSSYADNYRTRGARLNLAYVRVTPLSWVRIDGGRFEMPVPLTEMLWDGTLKPQGGALTLTLKPSRGEFTRFSLTGLAARGSHYFADEHTNMVLFSGTAELKGGARSTLAFVGSLLQYTDFNDKDALDPRLVRQNSRTLSGGLATRFRVLDLQARVAGQGKAPSSLVLDYCVNTQADKDNRGLWLNVTLGALPQTRAAWSYTYARIDRDATLGAYNTDNFFFHTDWEGHRGEIGTSTGRTSALYLSGEYDRPRLENDTDGSHHWTRRLRVEWRVHGTY